jgi:hypothetical protein
MKKTFKIYLLGGSILIGAIIINYVADFFGMISWYEVLGNRIFNLNILNWIYLIILYPFLLGIIAYYFLKKILILYP